MLCFRQIFLSPTSEKPKDSAAFVIGWDQTRSYSSRRLKRLIVAIMPSWSRVGKVAQRGCTKEGENPLLFNGAHGRISRHFRVPAQDRSPQEAARSRRNLIARTSQLSTALDRSCNGISSESQTFK